MLQKLKSLSIQLVECIASARKLAADLVSQAASDALLELDRVIAILETPNGAMDRHTVGHVGAEAEEAIGKVAAMELKFLVSAAVGNDLYQRIKKLDVRRNEVHCQFNRWRAEASEKEVNASGIRKTYEDLLEVIAAAEKQMVSDRVRTIVAPPPAPRKRQRNNRKLKQIAA